MAEIKIIERHAMYPHDAAALVKLTRKGRDKLIEAMQSLKSFRYEVSVGEGDARIMEQLDRTRKFRGGGC